VAHAKAYAEEMAARLGLGPESLVVEVASNDGYLLQHFVAMDIPVLGIEPTTGQRANSRPARGTHGTIEVRTSFRMGCLLRG